MKTGTLLYTIGLLLIATSIFLVVSFPDSNRTQLIAGFIITIGFPLNIIGFLKKESKTA